MIEIRILKPSDDRTHFRSGNADLDRFFVRYAGQNQFRHHIGTTYVAVEDDLIKGFVTVSASHIEIDQFPDYRKKRLPGYPLYGQESRVRRSSRRRQTSCYQLL
jgi:hypothetical protein